MTEMSYSVKVSAIQKLLHYNQISINVLSYEKGEAIAVSTTTERFDTHDNYLLIISDGEKSHYC